MSNATTESFLPFRPLLHPGENDKKSPESDHMRDKVTMHSSRIAQKLGLSNAVSPVPPTAETITPAFGQLIPAPGGLSPSDSGRIKAPPVCNVPSLKRVASSIGDLNTDGVCFSSNEADSCAEKALLSSQASGGKGGATVVSASPLKVSRADHALSSEDEIAHETSSTAPGKGCLSATFTEELVKEKSSRQGRSLQRWLIHSPTGELVRQVAGTIPITRDGRIILVSASRKNEWILPKGGWEVDETKEECAARETYEEGGLLGRLGECLGPIDYESSKAKERRLAAEEKQQGDEKSVTEDEGSHHRHPKRAKTEKSMKGRPKKHSYIRLFLFPLYVSSVKSDWPEKGRLRKLVGIDEAIKIMEEEDRLYFKKGLEIMKERGLHLVKP